MQEKNLVFAFCAELKRQLDATKRYAIVMTRDGDQYVDLGDRVAIARKANASLFISVHADTLSEDANVSGSTVYTVADRASVHDCMIPLRYIYTLPNANSATLQCITIMTETLLERTPGLYAT